MHCDNVSYVYARSRGFDGAQRAEDADLDLGVSQITRGERLEAGILGRGGHGHLCDGLIQRTLSLEAAHTASKLSLEVEADEGADLVVERPFREVHIGQGSTLDVGQDGLARQVQEVIAVVEHERLNIGQGSSPLVSRHDRNTGVWGVQ